ncbi:hypothetical protein VTJ83DRAFT_5035 [Remersonia thermophila]|uniref:C-CAP/cofactor C-like domain-containing protein n=1 Tax=Remersonia thermophila TaxID=72144 RepID=A0ABR4DBM5_9PEZI
MATNHMHNLTTLIKARGRHVSPRRHCAVGLRTSSICHRCHSAVRHPSGPAVPGSPQTAIGPTPPTSAVAPPPPPPEPVPESIEEFDNLISQSLEKWVKISDEIGGVVATQAAKVLEAFKEERKFLLITTKAKKPDMKGADMSVFQDLVQPISKLMTVVGGLKDANRGDANYNNLATVAESMLALAWVTIDIKPFKHVEESLAAAQFWGNKVLTAHKNKDEKQIEWVNTYYQVFRDLAEYVKSYFPNGIPWNPQGVPAAEAAKAINAAASTTAAPASARGAGGPPPPPPPPPPGPPPVLKIDALPSQPSGPSGLGAVFSELNKGEAVTKGLRKVDKSEMTHKNPALRAGSTVPERSSSSAIRGKSPAPPGTKPKPESMRVKKPPKQELEGNKWTIENYDKPSAPIELEVTLNQSVLISKCVNTTIILRGKANAVTVENTQRLSLVVESLVSTVDVVKSTNFALQVLETIPTVLLDQVDSAQIYLSKESSSTRVYSSKSAGINLNVLVPGEGGEDDSKELPLPSQICSWWDPEKGDVINEIVSHAG